MTLYYNNATTGDTTWDNILNWWTDAAFTNPSGAIPVNGDTAYIESYLATGPSVAVTLAALFISQITSGGEIADSGSGIAVTGAITLGTTGGNVGAILGTLTCSTAVFYATSINDAALTGDATFNDSSYIGSGTVTGDATFNDSSCNNGGTVNGDATFNDASFNYGTVSSAVFNGTSYNDRSLGVVSGDATFNGTVPASGTVGGAAIFSGSVFNTDPTGNLGSYGSASFTSPTPVSFHHVGGYSNATPWSFTAAGATWYFLGTESNGGTVNNAHFALTAAVSQIKNQSGNPNVVFNGTVTIEPEILGTGLL